MKITEALKNARDGITVKCVFAEPHERERLTVVKAASVTGGAGGGSDTDPEGQQRVGGDYAASTRPVGAYVIKDRHVHWRPANDPNIVVAVVGLIANAYLLRSQSKRGLPLQADPR